MRRKLLVIDRYDKLSVGFRHRTSEKTFKRHFFFQDGEYAFPGCFRAVSGCFTEKMGALYVLFTVTPNFKLLSSIYAGNI